MNNVIKALGIALGLASVSVAHANVKATANQKLVASKLKALTTQKGSALYGVYARSIKATNIKTRQGGAAGPAISFSVKGLQKRDPVGGLKRISLVDITGKYMAHSFIGPILRITRVTPEKMPIETLE